MLRHATPEDIPWLAHQMLLLKTLTGWATYPQPGYNYESLTRFLTLRLVASDSVCWVWCPAGVPTAFCGGDLQTFVLPPYMPCVLEWGWGGERRGAVRCWHALVAWGRDHGAQLAGRVQPSCGYAPNRIEEYIKWKVINHGEL